MPPTRPPYPQLSRAVLATLMAVALPLALLSGLPAGAATTLCSGYDDCSNKGYRHYGYKQNEGTMYWRMYSGPNCTNYVAYRLVRSGMPNVRPWDGTGMAYNWGSVRSDITDRTPAVGSVAWWPKNYNGMSSSGHVAFVEEVISPGEIIVSESHWRGAGIAWRRLEKGDGRWPKGFIHFNDKSVSNTQAPTISGTPMVDSPLTANPGSWSPTPDNLTYQWYAGGKAVSGATAQTFTPTAAMRNQQLGVLVRASAMGYGNASAAATTPAVKRGRFAAGEVPTVTGTAAVDETLTAQVGAWTPSPGSVSYTWRADGEPIAGATGPQLVLTQDLVGKRIQAISRVNRPGYVAAQKGSAASDPVLAGEIEVTERFTAAGRARRGSTATIRPGAFQPADASVSYRWYADGAPIPGASDPAYSPGREVLGKKLTAAAVLRKKHYLDRVEPLSFGVVRTSPKVRVKAAGRRGKALIRVTVYGAGLGRVDGGSVKVKIANRRVRIPVTNGKAKKWVPRIKAGKHRVVARWSGTREVTRGSATGKVRVR